MYVTGRMHNRARMIVASYLTKHLMTHWKVGMNWFEDCLIDWDPASNAMGWQWVAGSGTGCGSVFPHLQSRKRSKKSSTPRTIICSSWIAEGTRKPISATALAYFDAIPRSWGIDPSTPFTRHRSSDLADGRAARSVRV